MILQNRLKIKEGTKLVAAPVTYKIIEGADGTYTINADGTYTIRANGEFSKFVSVEMDGKVLDGKYYTAKRGFHNHHIFKGVYEQPFSRKAYCKSKLYRWFRRDNSDSSTERYKRYR